MDQRRSSPKSLASTADLARPSYAPARRPTLRNPD
jgi:hypothetical protein